MIITLPNNLTLEQWASCVMIDLPNNINQLAGDWKEWASQFLLNIDLANYNLPDPYVFGDWKDWAERFCGVING